MPMFFFFLFACIFIDSVISVMNVLKLYMPLFLYPKWMTTFRQFGSADIRSKLMFILMFGRFQFPCVREFRELSRLTFYTFSLVFFDLSLTFIAWKSHYVLYLTYSLLLAWVFKPGFDIFLSGFCVDSQFIFKSVSWGLSLMLLQLR